MSCTTILAMGLFMGTTVGNSYVLLVPNHAAAPHLLEALPKHQFTADLPGFAAAPAATTPFSGELELIAGDEDAKPTLEVAPLKLTGAAQIRPECLAVSGNCEARLATIRFTGDWVVDGVPGFDRELNIRQRSVQGRLVTLVPPPNVADLDRKTLPGALSFHTSKRVCLRVNGGPKSCAEASPRVNVPAGRLAPESANLPRANGMLISAISTSDAAEQDANADFHWGLFEPLTTLAGGSWTPIPALPPAPAPASVTTTGVAPANEPSHERIAAALQEVAVRTVKDRPWLCPPYLREP